MTGIKPFLNQLFEPLLIFTSFPIPLFSPSHSPSSSNTFDETEFPRRGFPLTVTDWRDMLVYLYTSHVHDINDERHAMMRIAMRKHAEGLRIGEMRRYVQNGHQIVVAQVFEEEGGKKTWVVRSGLRLLRFERGAAVNDVVRVDEAFAAPMNQGLAPTDPKAQQAPMVTVDQLSKAQGDNPADMISKPSHVVHDPEMQLVASGSSKPGDDPSSPHFQVASSPSELQSIEITKDSGSRNPVDVPPMSSPPPRPVKPHTFEAKHPSISIYSTVQSGTKLSVTGGDEGPFAETVQSTVERDLRGWALEEAIRPQAFYLHHLALLVAEVHDYSASAASNQSSSNIAGREEVSNPCACATFAEMVMAVVKDDAEPDVFAGKGVSTNNISSLKTAERPQETEKEIRSRYLKAKMAVEKKIYGNATEPASKFATLKSVDVQGPSTKSDIHTEAIGATVEHREYVQPPS